MASVKMPPMGQMQMGNLAKGFSTKGLSSRVAGLGNRMAEMTKGMAISGFASSNGEAQAHSPVDSKGAQTTEGLDMQEQRQGVFKIDDEDSPPQRTPEQVCGALKHFVFVTFYVFFCFSLRG